MLRLIGEVAVWTGLMLLVALGIAAVARFALRRWGPIPPVTLGWLAFGGALVIAGLSDRLGFPQPLVIAVGRREVPVIWAAVGALAGTAWAWRLYRRDRA